MIPAAAAAQNGYSFIDADKSAVRYCVAVRTRPLCPYPQVARFSGTGSPDDAANFGCKAPD